MTSYSLSPMRRLHHFHLRQRAWSLQSDRTLFRLLSVENTGRSRKSDHYRWLSFHLSGNTTRNISTLNGGNRSNSSGSKGLLFLEPINDGKYCEIHYHSRYNRNKHQDYTHSNIHFAVRHFSSLGTNLTDEDRKIVDTKHKTVHLERNDEEGKIEHDKHENDRYYYLIKQKYSPSRHQKYRPSSGDGLLEKTISNKPLKDRIVQSYADVVAYFMPKGGNNFI